MTTASGTSTSCDQVPKVSVLMTLFNDPPEFVRQAVNSILFQTYSDFEFVIVADGTSRDDTLSLLARFAEQDQRIRLFREPHRGITQTLILGMSFCRAALICRQDADDWSEPDRLAKQCEFMRNHPEVGVVGTAVRLCQERGQLLWTQSLPCEPGAVLQSFPTANPFVHGAICFRAEAARAVGGYNSAFNCTQDYEFLWRLCERFGGANLPDVLYHHRRTPGSQASQMNVVLASERPVVRLLAQQRARGESEDTQLISEMASRQIVGGPAQFRLGIADQQLLAGHYLASLKSYLQAIAGAPHKPTAYLKTIRWLLFVLAPPWRARLFGH